ncbi:uncharacterized protein TNCV_5119371 [Trichonephila clavipes]|nr:uncharacterized protein TNCV_5119371 [Trichonephila clavipes]
MGNSGHCEPNPEALGESRAAVAEWYRYRIVACLVTSSSPVPLKTHRVGQRCTLNLSRTEMSSRWCGVVVMRGGTSSGVLHRAEAVALFHLTTGHDFLGVYLHWFGLAAEEAFPVCRYTRMDNDQLPQCTGLDEYPTDDIVSRYWEAQRQMAKHGCWINKINMQIILSTISRCCRIAFQYETGFECEECRHPLLSGPGNVLPCPT